MALAWIGSGMKPAIAYDKAAPRESLNYIGGYRRGDGHQPAR